MATKTMLQLQAAGKVATTLSATDLLLAGIDPAGVFDNKVIEIDDAAQALLDTISTTQGVVLYNNGTDWTALAPGTSGQFFQTLGAAANPVWADTPFDKGHLHGLTLSNNAGDATNDIDIAAGECRDSANAANIVLASALTKRLDAVWAVGTNQGMLASGAALADGTYHIFSIKRNDTGVVDVAADSSATGANIAANTDAAYTIKRRIGSIVRASGAIVGFIQDGDEFKLKQYVVSINALNPGTSAVTRALNVPLGIRVKALVVVGFGATTPASDNPAGILITDLSETDRAPSVTDATILDYSVSANFFAPVEVYTDTSAQVRSRLQISAAGTRLYILTRGWVDTRGRLA